MNPTADAVNQILGTGIVGAFCVLALGMFWSKDRSLTAEMRARISDAEKFTSLVMAIQKEVIGAVSALAKIADQMEKRDEERDRILRELDKQREDRERLEREAATLRARGFDEDPRRTGPNPSPQRPPRGGHP